MEGDQVTDDHTPATIYCHGCRGGTPHDQQKGWYSLSVNVPPELGKNGKPYIWLGVWCSLKCLAHDFGDLQSQEMLAHYAYSPDLPVVAP